MKVNRKQNIETLSIVTFNQKALAFIPRFIQNFIIGIQKNPVKKIEKNPKESGKIRIFSFFGNSFFFTFIFKPSRRVGDKNYIIPFIFIAVNCAIKSY